MNTNNGKTGNVNIPGALHSTGGDGDGQVGGVVAYAGDIYDVTAGKNQATLNAEFAEGITNASSSSFSGNYNDLSDIPLLKTAENGFKVNAHGRRKNTANAQDSFAEGTGTTASGQSSHSEGGGTIASGTDSHAEGSGTSAVGNSSHAEGYYTTAIGSKSHAEGSGVHAYGDNTHAEGCQETLEPLVTRAYTATSGALYIDTEIFPGCVIYDTDDSLRRVLSCEYQESDNDYKVIFQGINEDMKIGDKVYVDFCACGKNSHTEGCDTHAYGKSSHAEGVHTITTNEAEHASGMYNMSTANKTLFSVGAGHDGGRMNAFEIDTSSNVYIYGVGGYDGTNSTTTGIKSVLGVISDIESNSSSSSSSYTHPSTHPASMITYSSSETYSSGNVGYEIKQLTTQLASKYTKPNNGIPSSDLDSSIQAALGYASDYNSNKSMYVKGVYKGSTSLVNSYGVAVIPDDSILVKDFDNGGYSIKNAGSDALGYLSLSLGYLTTTKGDRSVALGSKTMAYGNSSHVEGEGPGTTVKTTSDYTSGGSTIYLNGSIDKGVVLVYNNNYTVVSSCSENGLGVFAVTISPSFSTSILSNSTIRKYTGSVGFASHAEGLYTIADGTASHAEGSSTRAYGSYSHAEGDSTIANNETEHAEGKCNVSHSGTISSIGIGTSSSDRKNAFEVLSNGNIYVKGLGNYNGTSIANVDSLQTVITDVNTRLTNIPVKRNDGGYGVEIYTRKLFKNTALDSESIAAGMKSVSVKSGCTTFGAHTYAIGVASLAQGCSSVALGAYSHAEGCSTDGTRSLSSDTNYAENNGDSLYSVTLAKNYSSGSRYIYTDEAVDAGYLLTELNVGGSYDGDDIRLLEDFSYDDYDGLKRTRLVRSCEWDSTNNAFKLDIGEDGFDVSISKPHTLHFIGGAFGAASHSEGYRTAAYGEFSHSQGEGTIAFGNNSCVVGQYNFASSDDLFAVGNGTGNWNDRSNALVVKSNGDVYIKGIGTYDGTNIGQNGVKSVQQVIADLTQQISKLSNN